MAWDEVARRVKDGALAILPVGSGAKQHGLHLCMAADQIQADWLSARLATTFDALVWPILTYGHYPAFVDYAGSVSLSSGLFEQCVREVATSLLGHGVRGLVVVDTGISTNAPIARALASVERPDRCVHIRIYDGPRFREAVAMLETPGQHADETETSILLALAPDTVQMDRAIAGGEGALGPGPMQRQDATAANYSASGAIGDPRGATRAKGEALTAAMLDDAIAAVARCFDAERGPDFRPMS